MEADFPFIKSPKSLRNIDQHQIRYFSFDLKGFGRDLNADHRYGSCGEFGINGDSKSNFKYMKTQYETRVELASIIVTEATKRCNQDNE